MQILRPVTVKARVTEGLKARLAAELQEAMQIMDAEMQQLESQVKRAQLAATIDPQQQMRLRQLVEQERAERSGKKAQLQEELRAITGLPIGAEIVQGTAQSLVTIDIGSEYDTSGETEVVIEDGKVVAIRKGGA